jgi:hypothetical protein
MIVSKDRSLRATLTPVYDQGEPAVEVILYVAGAIAWTPWRRWVVHLTMADAVAEAQQAMAEAQGDLP